MEFDTFTNRERLAQERLAGRGSLESERVSLARKEEPKLRQLLQRFFSKAAYAIVSSRCDLPPTFTRDGTHVKKDRWFNLEFADSDLLNEAIVNWTSADIRHDNPPPPMIIEIYLDMAELGRNQTLMAVDDRKRRWDVKQVLTTPAATEDHGKRKGTQHIEVVLERWTISLGDATPAEHSDPLPVAYKKALVLFRCLLTYAMLRPAYRFFRNAGKQSSMLNTLRPNFRIVGEKPKSASKDPLLVPLWPRADSVAKAYRFDPVLNSIGSMNIEVAYRRECEFLIDDAEAVLSSQFRGMDDQYFRPSLGASNGQDMPFMSAGGKEAGSLPADRHAFRMQHEAAQAPASLSTFHRAGIPAGTSPISALRAAREINSQSPTASPPVQTRPAYHRPGSGSRSSLTSADGAPAFPRRTSISFQPFKAGSLSSSPAMAPPLSPGVSPSTNPSSLTSGLTQQARSRTTSNVLPQSSLRIPQPAPETAVTSPGPSSPKAPTISRYSSSFGHRKRWSSGGSGGNIRFEDDANNSSGRASQSSSTQPESGLLNETTDGGESSSMQTDDDNISDFLKLVEQNKDLRSFNRTDDASRDASNRRTTAALTKFHRLRESHTQLTESLSSSLTLHRSSSSSSRQLSSVPPALVGNSVSTSSSPGKPISPHTPHTPAIPSRLSANAPISASDEDSHHRHQRFRSTSSPTLEEAEESEAVIDSEDPNASSPTSGSARTRTPGAIDIPTSPHRVPYIRRSSSARNRHRIVEDEFGMRSASVPDERQDLSLSELLALNEPMTGQSGGGVITAAQAVPVRPRSSRNTLDIPEAVSPAGLLDASEDRRSSPSASASNEASTSLPRSGGHVRGGSGSGSGSYSSFAMRPRLMSRAGGRGSSGSSFDRSRWSFSARRERDSLGAGSTGGGDTGTGSGSGVGGAGGLGADDEEPLLFTMSELETQAQQQQQHHRSSGSRDKTRRAY